MKRNRRSRLIHSSVLAGLAGAVASPLGVLADTLFTFDLRPAGQVHNEAVIPSFGDFAISSGPGIQVTGIGTSDIDMTFGGENSGRWDYYNNTVWTAAQMNAAGIGTPFDITFDPSDVVGVSLKSFNLHAYYTTGTTYDYEWSVLDGETVLASGTASATSDGAKYPVPVNFQGEKGQTLILRLTRTGGDGRADSIAIDDLLFAQFPELLPAPSGAIAIPLAGTETTPEISFDALLVDGQKKVDPGSIQLRLDAQALATQITTEPGKYRIRYADATRLFDSASAHQYSLTYQDNAVPPASYTNEVSFTVRSYTQITLPAPLYLETFESTAEGSLPPGWTSVAYIPGLDPEFNLEDLNSASYENWTVISRSRFGLPFLSYTAHTLTEDYARVLTPNDRFVVNGKLVKQFGSGNLLFSTSGYRSGPGQYVEVLTSDYNLSGVTDVRLSFHSLWEQNQDSIAVVEYSLDEGQTWLPGLYLIDSPDIALIEEGQVDAITTLTTSRNDTANYTDPNSGESRGTVYGDFVRAEITEALAPFIQGRVDDSAAESKRVELISLPAADNQPKVRFRIAHSGTDSWYFGIDDFGIYGTSSAARLSIAPSAGKLVISWDKDTGVLQRAPSPAGPWTGVPSGEISGRTHTVDPSTFGASQFYQLR